MEFLNKKSKLIFCSLIQKMNCAQHLCIGSDVFIPLIIEEIGDSILTPWGVGKQYSLSQCYKQNSDLIRDPEMCFVVTNYNEDFLNTYNDISVIPYMYQQDQLSIYQESVFFIEQEIAGYLVDMYNGHVEFADFWLNNLMMQGFLKIDIQ